MGGLSQIRDECTPAFLKSKNDLYPTRDHNADTDLFLPTLYLFGEDLIQLHRRPPGNPDRDDPSAFAL
jgi:hypothetical protein